MRAIQNVKIISHRGNINGQNSLKENTKDALLNALCIEGVDGIEFDVDQTTENSLVIHHRTKEQQNIPLYESDLLNSKQIVTLFEETLIKLAYKIKEINKNDFLLDIEIKKYNHIQYTSEYEERIIQIICNTISGCNYFISSFSYQVLKTAKKINPNLKTGILIPSNIDRNNVNIYADDKDIDFLCPRINQFIMNIKQYSIFGKHIYLWHVLPNYFNELLSNQKIDGIITDYANEAVQTKNNLMKAIS